MVCPNGSPLLHLPLQSFHLRQRLHRLVEAPCGAHELLHVLNFALHVLCSELELPGVDGLEATGEVAVGAARGEAGDGGGGEVEVLEALGAGEGEEEALIAGIEVRDGF